MEDSSFKTELIIAAWLHNILEYAKSPDILERISQVLPSYVSSENVLRLIKNWYARSSFEESIIAEADRLSRGLPEYYSLPNMEDSFYSRPILLEHLIATLQIPNREKPQQAYCKFLPLENDNILPVQKETYLSAKNDYADLWNAFENDLEKLKDLSEDMFLKALSTLLERYWCCGPASTSSEAESLYQHSKMTAAFATALYEYHKGDTQGNYAALKDYTDKKFRFIKGDISGIQKYIFDLKTTNNNAKLLRAKSFQIAALSEILSEYIVRKFGVTYANIIMSAGGNFMVLIPNTVSAKELLPQLQLDIESYFLDEYAGKLAVIVSDGVEASPNDLLKENVQDLMNRIGENTDKCKQKKMQKALEKGAVLSGIYKQLQEYGECPKCGVFPASGLEEDGSPCECEDCKKLTQIGGNLVRAGSVLIDSETLESFAKMVKVDKSYLPGGSLVNDYKAGKPITYMPYTAPKGISGEILTFEELAAKASGNNKLAMFKSDIDNLGLVFSASLGERMSFSRYADLSHQLHYFFSAYYTWFVRNHTYLRKGVDVPYSDVIYTVFSGGDDLCLLGAWDAVLQFATDFEAELRKFTNNNPSVSLSGGITLSSCTVPVKNIAANAEESLETSKRRKEEGRTVKNAITVFGTTVSWQDYKKCLENGHKLESYLEQKKLSAGVVYKLIDFAERAERIKHGDVSELLNPKANLRDQIWKSNFRYIAARNIKNNDELYDWFLQVGASQEEIIKSRIAVSYALYTQRNN